MRPFDLRIIKVLLQVKWCLYIVVYCKRCSRYRMETKVGGGENKNQQLHKAGFNDECLYSGKQRHFISLGFFFEDNFLCKTRKRNALLVIDLEEHFANLNGRFSFISIPSEIFNSKQQNPKDFTCVDCSSIDSTSHEKEFRSKVGCINNGLSSQYRYRYQMIL